MDFSSVKLVVSDMDGTLLDSNHQLSSEFIKIHERFKELGLTFVAASGRQYESMVDKLHMMKDDIYIIAENGAITKHKEEVLQTEFLKFSLINEIVPILRNIEDTLFIFCAKDNAYTDTKQPEMIDYMKQYYTQYRIVDDLMKLDDLQVYKIAIRHPISSKDFILPYLNSLNTHPEIMVKVSSKHWIDISSKLTNKGNALEKLQNHLGITAKETMVFGDYNNDLEMLEKGYFSFAMENAHPDVKKTAKFLTKSNDNNGVEYILQQLIKAQN